MTHAHHTPPAHSHKHSDYPSAVPLRLSRNGTFMAVLFTIMLVGLLVFAIHPIARELSFLMVGTIVLAITACATLLPGSMFFTLSLANLIAVYSCFFVIILDSHFRTVEPMWHWIGYLSPLVAFFMGSLLRRSHIRSIVRSPEAPNPVAYAHALLMMLPLIIIAIGTMIYASSPHSPIELRNAFLFSMGLSSVIVAIASRDMVVFLLVTGLLFESFFHRMAELIAPIFAFFTFYSFVILVFGATYAGIDGATGFAHFRINGVERVITFPEALYYSLATLATVGYGDIVPASNIMRMISALEVMCGIVLLLFGFNEILSHAREATNHRKNRSGK